MNAAACPTGASPLATAVPASRLARIGLALRRHGRTIRMIQWAVVFVYLALLLIPAALPLPPEDARLFGHLGTIAQFVFWGIWWPFVLISMVLFGRVWCGVFCPEGALAEQASRVGLGRGIPRWLRWQGWPFVAFVLTTVYGQLVSVYQYPLAAALVLGGSTVAAIAIGLLYGRNKRVWCRHLCPVSGVFSLLARLAPVHYRSDPERWTAKAGGPVQPVNCAPLLDIRRLHGAAQCHACGRCAGQRGAVELTARAPSEEIVRHGAQDATRWDLRLVLYGLCGVAMGAFHWTASPWFIDAKQAVAMWLLDHGGERLLDTDAPWWLLTHQPERHDVFSWLDGLMIIAYIGATGLVVGAVLHLLCAIGARLLAPRPAPTAHLSLAFVPLAGAGVFLGLSALTVSLLRGDGFALPWVGPLRELLLAAAALWTLRLGWGISGRYGAGLHRRLGATLLVAAGAGFVVWGWALLFWLW